MKAPPLGARSEGERAVSPLPTLNQPETLRRYRTLGPGLAASDALCLIAALLISFLVRFGLEPMPVDFAVVVGTAPLLWIGVFHAFRLYATQRLSPPEEFRRIIGATSVGMVLVVMASFWSKASLSRAWIGLTWAFVILFELAARRMWRWFIGRMRRDGRLRYRTVIIGGNPEAAALGASLRADADLGFDPLGYVLPMGAPSGSLDGLPVLGRLEDLEEVVVGEGVECVFVASTGVDLEDMRKTARTARRLGLELRVSANIPEILTNRLTVQPIGRVMALSLAPVRLTGSQAAVKRVFDVVLSLLLLAITLPVLIGVAVAIRATSRGRILYRQSRVGRRGNPFTMYKLRTMVASADDMRGEILDLNDATGPLFKLRDDPRVTKVGRWLRRWSLDELPQLVNVLRGEMSLVGPRPPLPEEVSRYEDWHFDRLEVRPGITGLWQVSGRSDLSFDDYVNLDLLYIQNWSPAYDLYILLKTVPAVLSGRGSY